MPVLHGLARHEVAAGLTRARHSRYHRGMKDSDYVDAHTDCDHHAYICLVCAPPSFGPMAVGGLLLAVGAAALCFPFGPTSPEKKPLPRPPPSTPPPVPSTSAALVSVRPTGLSPRSIPLPVASMA